jgi:hypothetical protein
MEAQRCPFIYPAFEYSLSLRLVRAVGLILLQRDEAQASAPAGADPQVEGT